MKRLYPLSQLALVNERVAGNTENPVPSEVVLDPYDYFPGSTRAWGLFEDRFGRVRRQFQVEIEGVFENGMLRLTEDFLYDNGERDQRIWRIRRNGPRAYIGRAADVVGDAHGVASGNELSWSYVMDLRMGNRVLRVSFSDRMLLQADGVLLNRAKVRKFGLELGSVSLFFKKLSTGM